MEEKLKRLETLVDQNLNRKEMHFLLAENYFKANRIEQAKQSFLNAIAIDPFYLKAYMRLGEIYILDERFGEAEAIFNDIIHKTADSSDSSESLYMVAMAYKNNKIFDRALTYLRKLLLVDRVYYQAYIEIADIHFDQEQYEEATNNYQKALDFDKKRITLYVKLAYTHYMNNDSRKALQILNEGLLIDGSYVELHFLMAKIYSDLEMQKELAEKVEFIRELAPHMVEEFCQKFA